MGPQAEFLETVLTCKGNYYAPDFSLRLNDLKCRLQKLVIPDNKKNLEVKKVEPWNSVRVTLKLPADAAYRLKHLAEQRDGILREIGILAVQIEGDRVISLTLDSTSQSNNTSVQNDNIICSSSIPCPVKNVPSNDLSKPFSINNTTHNNMPISKISSLNQFSMVGTKLNECPHQRVNNVHMKPQRNSTHPTFINALDHEFKHSTLNSNNTCSAILSSQYMLPVKTSPSSSFSSPIASSIPNTNSQIDDNLISCQNIASSSPLLVNLLKSPGGRTNFNNSSQLSTHSICEAMELSSLPTQKRKRNQTKRSKRLKESPDLNYLYTDQSVNYTQMPSYSLSSSLSSSSSSLSTTPYHNELHGTWSQQAIFTNGSFDYMQQGNNNANINCSSELAQKNSNIFIRDSEHSEKHKDIFDKQNLNSNDLATTSVAEANINVANSHSSSQYLNNSFPSCTMIFTPSTTSSVSYNVDSLQMKHIISSQSSPSVSHFKMSKYSNSPSLKMNLNMNNHDNKNSSNNNYLITNSSTSSHVSQNSTYPICSVDTYSITRTSNNEIIQSSSTLSSSSFTTNTSLSYTQSLLNHISFDSQSKILAAQNLLNYITSVQSDLHIVNNAGTIPTTSTLMNSQLQQSYINSSLFNLKSNVLTLQNPTPNTVKNINMSLQSDQKVCSSLGSGGDVLGQNGRLQLHNLIKSTITEQSSGSWIGNRHNPILNDNKEELANVLNTSSVPFKLVTQPQQPNNSEVFPIQLNQLWNMNQNYTQILKELMPRLSTPLLNRTSSIINSPVINGHQLHLTNPSIISNNLKLATSAANFLTSKNFIIKLPEEQINNNNANNNNNNGYNNNFSNSVTTPVESSLASDVAAKHIASSTSSTLTSQSSLDVKFVPSNLASSVTVNDSELMQCTSASSKYPPLKKPCKSAEDPLPQRSKANLTVAQLLEQVEIAKHNQLTTSASGNQKCDASIDVNCGININVSTNQTCTVDNNDIKIQKPLQMTVVPLMPYPNKYQSEANYNSSTRASMDSIPMPITSPGYPHNLTESVQKAMRGVDFHNSPPSSPSSSGVVQFTSASTATQRQSISATKVWPQSSIELTDNVSTECSLHFQNTLTDILSNRLNINDTYDVCSKDTEHLNDNRNFITGVDPNDFDFVFNAEDENHLDSIIASKDYDDIERLAETLASNIDDGDIDEAMLMGEDDSDSLEQQAHLKDVSELIKNDYLSHSIPSSDHNMACQLNAEEHDKSVAVNLKLEESQDIKNEIESSKQDEGNGKTLEEDRNSIADVNYVDSNDCGVNPQTAPFVNKKIKKKVVASKKDNSNNCGVQDSNKNESMIDDTSSSNVTRMSTRSSNKAKCMSSTATTSMSCLPNSVEPLVVLTPTTSISLKDIKNDNTTTMPSTTSTTTTTMGSTTPTPRRSGRTIKKTELALESTHIKTSDKPRRASLREHFNNKELYTDLNNTVNKSSSNSTKVQIISLSIKQQEGHARLTKNKNTPALRRHKSNNNQSIVINEADESNDSTVVDKKEPVENDKACLSDETLELSISSDESVPTTKKQKVF